MKKSNWYVAYIVIQPTPLTHKSIHKSAKPLRWIIFLLIFLLKRSTTNHRMKKLCFASFMWITYVGTGNSKATWNRLDLYFKMSSKNIVYVLHLFFSLLMVFRSSKTRLLTCKTSNSVYSFLQLDASGSSGKTAPTRK